jgi:hypothetical protein
VSDKLVVSSNVSLETVILVRVHALVRKMVTDICNISGHSYTTGVYMHMC